MAHCVVDKVLEQGTSFPALRGSRGLSRRFMMAVSSVWAWAMETPGFEASNCISRELSRSVFLLRR